MRYEDWDILLFPQDLEVPMKEFRVACHVVHDSEFSHAQGSFGLPTLCCFVPSLPAGTPFQISIHSWTVPAISPFTKVYSMYSENSKLEFRLFIDGGLVASTSLNRENNWPHVMSHTFDFSKNGELEPIKFPFFQKEILQQDYWSPADDLGRIRLVISEGFPRDSLSTPIERVKNLVAFSFQHAPLDILENSSLAWPNPTMWRRPPYTPSMPIPTYHEDSKSHAHSPRRNQMLPGATSSHNKPTVEGVMVNSCGQSISNQGHSFNTPETNPHVPPGFEGLNAFEDSNVYSQWLSSADEMGMIEAPQHFMGTSSKARGRRKASTDISMPDYAPYTLDRSMAISGDAPFMQSSFQIAEDGNAGYLKAPSNTPTIGGHNVLSSEGPSFTAMPNGSAIPTNLANTLTSSLLNQAISFQFRPPNLPAPMPEAWPPKDTLACRSNSYTKLCFAPTAFHQDDHNISQRVNIPSVVSTTAHLSDPQPHTRTPKILTNSELSQRTPSMSKSSDTLASIDGQDNSVGLPPSSSDKQTKRVRHFTPVSAKEIKDEEGGLLQASPSIRLTQFSEVS